MLLKALNVLLSHVYPVGSVYNWPSPQDGWTVGDRETVDSCHGRGCCSRSTYRGMYE